MRAIVSYSLINDAGGTAAAVTERLGIDPSATREAGLPVSRVDPSIVGSTASWSLTHSPADEVRLSEAIEHLLYRLEPVASQIWELVAEGYSGRWLCTLSFPAGEAATELLRETTQRVLRLPGDLWIDFYNESE